MPGFVLFRHASCALTPRVTMRAYMTWPAGPLAVTEMTVLPMPTGIGAVATPLTAGWPLTVSVTAPGASTATVTAAMLMPQLMA